MSNFNTSKIDGNTLVSGEWNQLADANNLVINSGQTPSTSNLDQLAIASARYSSGGQFFTDSGTANAYVLTPVSPFKSAVSSGAGEGYFNGMIIIFRAGNANSGASTINVNSAGVKNLKKADGATDLTAGDILTTVDVVFRYDGTNFIKLEGVNPATATIQGKSYLPKNITIANNSTDADNDIDFTAGNFQFSDNSGNAVLSALTKRLDASWTAGTNQGGLFSGNKANSTWYYLYAIANLTSGVVDAGYDISPTSPTLPAGFTKRSKVLFAVKTNSSGNILGGTWLSDRSFYFNTEILEEQNGLTSGNLALVGVPILPLKAIMRAEVGALLANAYPILSVGISNVCIIFVAGSPGTGGDYGNGEVPTSNATIYRAIISASSFGSKLITNGYILTN